MKGIGGKIVIQDENVQAMVLALILIIAVLVLGLVGVWMMGGFG